jgi:hypothetical protein
MIIIIVVVVGVVFALYWSFAHQCSVDSEPDYSKLPRKELQALAKKNGIPANLKVCLEVYFHVLFLYYFISSFLSIIRLRGLFSLIHFLVR